MNLQDLYTNKNGIILPNTADVQEQVVTGLKSVFGVDVDTTPETPMGRLIEFLGMSFKSVLGVNAQNANQQNIHTATGRYLDGHGSIYNIYRYGASYSTVLATITGPAGAIVPVGFKVTSEESGATFTLPEEVELNSEGLANVTMQAVDPGPITCPTGSLTEIETSTSSVYSVTNNSPAVLGRDEETDEELRRRILASLNTGRDFLASIRNALYSIPGVNSCVVLENGDSQDTIIKGVMVEGHSIFVCVYGGDVGESGGFDEDEVAAAIYKAKPAGCGYTHSDLNVNLDDEDSGALVATRVDVVDENVGNLIAYPVWFYRPRVYHPEVAVAVARDTYTGTDLVADVKSVISDYINALPVGRGVTAIELGKKLMDALPGIYIQSLTVNKMARFPDNGMVKLVTDEDKITVSLASS